MVAFYQPYTEVVSGMKSFTWEAKSFQQVEASCRDIGSAEYRPRACTFGGILHSGNTYSKDYKL
jgi:hypothetical protein